MAVNENYREEEGIFLSICIPTYNRIIKTHQLVQSILTYQGGDIEVVVLDNCSTDTTFEVLSKINDSRFSFIKNNSNIGGMPNLLKALTVGSGEFVILCLDKDLLNVKYLTEFIEILKTHKEIAFGQTVLNTNEIERNLIYDRGLSSLLNFAYTSEHPSGLFFKNKILKDSDVIKEILVNDKLFAFNTELIKSSMSLYGKSMRVHIPLIYTETLEECKNQVSHTYKGSNIYFFPKNVILTFNNYVKNLYSLKLSKNENRAVLNKIYRANLYAATFGFKMIMKNNSICLHHSIMLRDVTIFEVIRSYAMFNYNFLTKNVNERFFWKIYFISVFHFTKLFNLLKRNK